MNRQRFSMIAKCCILVCLMLGLSAVLDGRVSYVNHSDSRETVLIAAQETKEAPVAEATPAAENASEVQVSPYIPKSTAIAADDPTVAPVVSDVPEVSETPAVSDSTERMEVPASTNIPTAPPKEKLFPATPAPTAVPTPVPTKKPNTREEIVHLAKSYRGEITYLWGGKPTNNDIKGKTTPRHLDCSGFVQFVYSKVLGKRVNSLGSTIAIARLEKIKKSELKIGDIGLKRGTGSLYLDADGKSYPEPGLAQRANQRKLLRMVKKIKKNRARKNKLYKKYKKYDEKVSRLQQEMAIIIEQYEGAELLESEETDEGNAGKPIIDEDKLAADRQKILTYRQEMRMLHRDIEKVVKQIKREKKVKKHYEEEITRHIDHVGIYCGKDKDGNMLWCHCSSSGDGVVFGVTDIFKHYFRYSSK